MYISVHKMIQQIIRGDNEQNTFSDVVSFFLKVKFTRMLEKMLHYKHTKRCQSMNSSNI